MNYTFSLTFLLYAFTFADKPLNNITFYEFSNDKLLKLQQNFINSKKSVQDIYSLKSDEKSRVLILDYVEFHDDLLSIFNSTFELLNIYTSIPKIKKNKKLLDVIKNKIALKFIDISIKLEELIDSFDFYIKNEMYNYKKINIIKSNMLLALNEIRIIIDDS